MKETGPEAVPPPDSCSRDERSTERLVPVPLPNLKSMPSVFTSSRIDSIESSTELLKRAALPLDHVVGVAARGREVAVELEARLGLHRTLSLRPAAVVSIAAGGCGDVGNILGHLENASLIHPRSGCFQIAGLVGRELGR